MPKLEPRETGDWHPRSVALRRRLALVGKEHGGSWPVSDYTARTLEELVGRIPLHLCILFAQIGAYPARSVGLDAVGVQLHFQTNHCSC